MKDLKTQTKTKESTPAGGMTYEQIGKILGITKQGVRRIEKRAIRKLKKKIYAKFGTDISKIQEYLIYEPNNQY